MNTPKSHDELVPINARKLAALLPQYKRGPTLLGVIKRDQITSCVNVLFAEFCKLLITNGRAIVFGRQAPEVRLFSPRPITNYYSIGYMQPTSTVTYFS